MLSPENKENDILIMKKKCDIKFVINFQRWASREKVKIYMYYICFSISLHNIDVHIYKTVNNHYQYSNFRSLCFRLDNTQTKANLF